MVDAETLILAELDVLAPPADVPAPDWRDVVGRARPARPRPRRRLLLVLAVLVALAAVVGPALALSDGVRRLVGLSFSAPPRLVRGTIVVSAPAPHGQVLRVVVGPSPEGGRCVFVLLAAPGSPPLANRVGGGGGQCTAPGEPLHAAGGAPLALSWSMGREPTGPGRAVWVPAVLSGWVAPRLHAARVELVWRGDRQRLAFHHDYFVAATPALRNPPFADLPFDVVAYARDGRELARQRLPESMLYLEWKRDDIAGKLHRWKVAHRQVHP